MRKSIVMWLAALSLGVAHAADFRTPEPLKAFMFREYPLFRCLPTKNAGPFEGVALSDRPLGVGRHRLPRGLPLTRISRLGAVHLAARVAEPIAVARRG